MRKTEQVVKSAVKKQVNKITPIKMAFREKIELLFITALFIIIMFIVGFGVIIFNDLRKEKKMMHNDYYYIYSKLATNSISSTSERKQKFQMKIIGIMKEMKSDLTNKEMLEFTSYVFDKSEEYGWDPYIPIGFAWTESCFKKKAVGYCNDKGMFQFLPSTAKMVAGNNYYNNIEFNVLDSTKLWFKYFKILVDYFDGNLQYSILAYNMGERGVVYYSKLKRSKNKWLFENGNLISLKQKIYINKKRTPYDEKIYKVIEFARTYGTNKQIKLLEK